MHDYPRLAARLFNTPLMARLDAAQTYAAALERLVFAPGTDARVTASGIDQPRYEDYAITEDGIAVLTIEGPLVQRAGQINPNCSPITSYQSINAQLGAMAANDDVKAILLELDSPGGEVANVFELGRRFGVVREQTKKPVWAIANEGAFSAGYALAAGADRILLPATAMVGSVGVIMMHVDMSRALDKKGFAVTPIFAGARKNDFTPYEPLTREALIIGQARIDELYATFTEYVAEQRNVDVAAVRATEAGIFNATEARRLGLADQVATFDEALAELADYVRSQSTSSIYGFSTRLAGASLPTKGVTMAKQDDAPANNAALQEQLNTARNEGAAQATKDAEAKHPAIRAEGATTERARIKAILTSEAAKTRPILASHLAFETEMAADAATAMLAKAGAEVATKPANALAEAMKGTNPGVGADADKPAGDAPAAVIDTANVYAMRRKASGHAQ